MREILQKRLESLKKELESGQSRLQELERQQMYLRDTLLRISGAIQVLEEVLKESAPEAATLEMSNSAHDVAGVGSGASA
jgi:predicted nuclease with TOPRIM domain